MSLKWSPKSIKFGEPLEPLLGSFSCQNPKKPLCFHTFRWHPSLYVQVPNLEDILVRIGTCLVKIMRILYVFIHSVDMRRHTTLHRFLLKSCDSYMFSYILWTCLTTRFWVKTGAHQVTILRNLYVFIHSADIRRCMFRCQTWKISLSALDRAWSKSWESYMFSYILWTCLCRCFRCKLCDSVQEGSSWRQDGAKQA